MPKAYLGLGGNLGDRLAHLGTAVRQLHQPPFIHVQAISPVYETAAVGNTAQPDFLNAVVEVATTYSPVQLLAECLRIEAGLGRVRRERWGPRTIDLDLLWYDDVRLADATLTLPHPRMTGRAFVLTPLAAIAPDLKLREGTVRELAAKLDQTGLRKIKEVLALPSGRPPVSS